MGSTVGGATTGSASSESAPGKWIVALAGAATHVTMGPATTVVLEEGGALTLERGAKAFGGALSDHRVSRGHATLQVDGGTLTVTDGGSRNGTQVNGRTVERAELQSGDAVRCGGALFVVASVPAEWQRAQDQMLVGIGPSHRALVDAVDTVAPHAATVLLTGATGTGKSFVARQIHERSGRSGALVSVDCGAVADDAVEATLFGADGLVRGADGGTLYLDAVGDASDRLQAVLSNLIETSEFRDGGRSVPVDVRIVAASRHDVDALLGRGELRASFVARLSQWVVHLPSLESRLEDLPAFAQRFAHQFAGAPVHLHTKLLQALLRHRWPTNLHGLRAAVERALIEAKETRPVPRASFLSKDAAGTPSDGGAVRLDVGADARWFRYRGTTTDLENRPPLARVLEHLVRRHAGEASAVTTPSELVEAGWPGESMDARAGVNRVYVAVATLRKFGLRAVIVRSKSGYRLSPQVRVRRVNE